MWPFSPTPASSTPHTHTHTSAGYNYPVDEVLEELVTCLDHPALPLLQWNEEFSFVESRLPAGLAPKLNAVTSDHEVALNSLLSMDRGSSEFPGRKLIRILREAVEVRPLGLLGCCQLPRPVLQCPVLSATYTHTAPIMLPFPAP
jgi:Acetyl-CoA carboxylase, central region